MPSRMFVGAVKESQSGTHDAPLTPQQPVPCSRLGRQLVHALEELGHRRIPWTLEHVLDKHELQWPKASFPTAYYSLTTLVTL